jgi:serine/threonine protein kinase
MRFDLLAMQLSWLLLTLSYDKVLGWTSVSVSRQFQAKSPSRRSLSSSALRMAKFPILDDWKVQPNGRVLGIVKDHPSIPDGTTVTTSPISDPDKATQNRVVTTISGSKYSLGNAQTTLFANGKSKPQQVSFKQLQRQAAKENDLTGEVVGDDTNQYLLSGKPQKSTSGKSYIYKAYRADEDGLPVGDPVLVKISNNWEALEREEENYRRITQSGFTRGQFVQLYDYLPTASLVTKKFQNFSALVMERGIIDLKRYISENGALSGRDLRDAASAAAQCLQAIHASGLVWTDMKSENFVVSEDGGIKGIDLESAIPYKNNPVDYSPEATPPEFAKAFLAGDGPDFKLDYSYDVWSFGIMLYELANGRSFWDGKSPAIITKNLKSDLMEVNLDKLVENKVNASLIDLIRQCTQINPSKRPGVVQILLHPYFITSGFGPISFPSFGK